MIKIFVYTSYFPFTKMSEAFLMTELMVGVNHDVSITLVPVNMASVQRKIPLGVNVDESLCKSSLWSKIKSFLLVIRYLYFFKMDDWIALIRPRYFFDSIKYLYASNLVYRDLRKRVPCTENDNTIFYSYWLSYTPIAFALYKHHNPNIKVKFIARGHGSDVYGPAVGVYYPLRDFVMNSLDATFIISQYGCNFLQKKYPGCRNKIILARLGVFDNRNYNVKDDVVRLVSCSSVIPLKRVELIYKSILSYAKSNPHKKLEWTHIGSGPLFDTLTNEVASHKLDNFNCRLLGSVNNSDILKLYREEHFSVFVLLSTSEGIPVSIMEAISSAIPVIATNVGGISEIVNKSTGYLLESIFRQEDFNKALDRIIEKNDALSESAYIFFKKNFEASHNYGVFFERLNYL